MPISLCVLAHRLLGGIGRVERLAGRVVAGPGVVAADDEVGAAVVAADDRVQQHLARPGHAHGQGQQAEHHGARLVVVVDQGAIATHARVVVHVARLGHADDRVDQEAAADLLGGALGQLLVRPVQGVAGLEGDDLAPAQRLEVLAELGRGAADLDEVVMRRHADHLEPARGVMARLPAEVGDRGVLGVGRAVGVPGLILLVVGVDLLDVEERQQVAVDVAQGQRLALGDAVAGRDRQGHGQGPEGAVGQPHLGDDPLVVGLAQERLQGREAADGQQLEVAQPPLVEGQAGEVLGGRLHLGGPLVADDQVDQRPAVGGIHASRRRRGTFVRCRSGGNRRFPFGLVARPRGAGQTSSLVVNKDAPARPSIAARPDRARGGRWRVDRRGRDSGREVRKGALRPTARPERPARSAITPDLPAGFQRAAISSLVARGGGPILAAPAIRETRRDDGTWPHRCSAGRLERLTVAAHGSD